MITVHLKAFESSIVSTNSSAPKDSCVLCCSSAIIARVSEAKKNVTKQYTALTLFKRLNLQAAGKFSNDRVQVSFKITGSGV